jgi:ATP-dependent DNA helicase RecQ
VPVVALTATATAKVRHDIKTQLGLTAARDFCRSFNRPNIAYVVKMKECVDNVLEDMVRADQLG